MATRVRIIDPAKLMSLYNPATGFQSKVIKYGSEEVEFDFSFQSKSFATGQTQLCLTQVDPKSRYIQASSFIHIEDDGSITIDYNGKQTKEFGGKVMDNFLLMLQALVSPEGDLLELQERTVVDSSFGWVDVTSNEELGELISKHLQLLL